MRRGTEFTHGVGHPPGPLRGEVHDSPGLLQEAAPVQMGDVLVAQVEQPIVGGAELFRNLHLSCLALSTARCEAPPVSDDGGIPKGVGDRVVFTGDVDRRPGEELSQEAGDDVHLPGEGLKHARVISDRSDQLDRGSNHIHERILTRRLPLGKGQQVAIEGRLQTRSWDDDRGQRHWKTEVVAAHVEMLSGRKKKDYDAEAAAGSLEAQAAALGEAPDGTVVAASEPIADETAAA
jgi:hypothetical protein